jgi:hypothetical protein
MSSKHDVRLREHTFIQLSKLVSLHNLSEEVFFFEYVFAFLLVHYISLIIALLTASLLPTAVILVSFMKNPNGTFKVKENKS